MTPGDNDEVLTAMRIMLDAAKLVDAEASGIVCLVVAPTGMHTLSYSNPTSLYVQGVAELADKVLTKEVEKRMRRIITP